MEFLTNAEAQAIYAEQVYEYPILETARISDIVKSFGEMNPDSRDLNIIGKLRTRASELVDIVGYNDGPR
jgi:iron(III) transport system substrate-binding protein